MLQKKSIWLDSYVLDGNIEKFPFCNFNSGDFDQFEEHVFDTIVNHNDYYHIGLAFFCIIIHPAVESMTTYDLLIFLYVQKRLFK